MKRDTFTPSVSRWINSPGKRVCDVLGGITLQAVFALPMLAIAAAIKLDTRGPVFYNQKRVGRNGKPFTLHKFRTLKYDINDLDGKTMVSQNDQRLTRVGKFLRRHHLDELPQLWNVMKADMTLVGPRPWSMNASEKARNLPGYAERLHAQQGLSGLAQISMDKTSTAQDRMKCFQYDKDYIAHASFAKDAKILFKTIGAVLGLGKKSH